MLAFPIVGVAKGVILIYQSRAGDPAVLTILATREGTSATVIDNTRDGFDAGRTWGQRLFFNQNGERASLTGQRKSDFLADTAAATGAGAAEPPAADREGLNMVLLIQVPLKQKKRRRRPYLGMCVACRSLDLGTFSDVEEAVIGHGEVEGPFTEIDGLAIERDDRYPVRVTVQFYKATSNGVVSESDMADIAEQIARVYRQADYVGSLVIDGPTGRPTEHPGPHVEPPDWWDTFWARHLHNTGQTRAQALATLEKLLGPRLNTATLEEAEAAFGKEADDHAGNSLFGR